MNLVMDFMGQNTVLTLNVQCVIIKNIKESLLYINYVKSINSSKSNKIPDVSYYLPKLSRLHHESLQIMIAHDKNTKVMEDYLLLGYTPKELADMNEDHFRELYERTFYPLSQIALNMGFETWKY